MKIFLSFLLVVSAFLSFQSCNKDQTPIQAINPSECLDTIKFSTQIMPMVQNACLGCHDSGGTSPTLNNHAAIVQSANSILLSIKAEGGKKLMPDGGPALADSLIKQFSCWMVQGLLNN